MIMEMMLMSDMCAVYNERFKGTLIAIGMKIFTQLRFSPSNFQCCYLQTSLPPPPHVHRHYFAVRYAKIKLSNARLYLMCKKFNYLKYSLRNKLAAANHSFRD
jgi:hypothetical protein